MSSIKCMACGLVNFATAANCKRCQQPLHELAPFTQERPYQQGMQPPPQQYNQPPQQFAQPHQNPPPQQRMPDFNSPPPPPVFNEQQQQFLAYEMPPPPPVFQGQRQMPQQQQQHMNCVKCGDINGASLQAFKKDYVPAFCYLGLLAGLLPMAILVSIFRRRHTINAPFCEGCWKSFKRAKLIETLTVLSLFPFVIVGAIFGTALNSGIVFFLFFAGFIGTAIYGQIYKKKNFPKFSKIDSKVVLIDTPTFGQLNFSTDQRMAL